MGSLTKASFAGSSPSVGGARRLLQTLALTIVGALILGVGSASARDNGHAFSFEIKPTGTAEFTTAPFGGTQPYLVADAVDNSAGPSSGDLYVIDYYGHRVEKFGPDGNFVLMFGDGVNQTTGGDVCTAASGNTCSTGNEGGSAESFQCPSYIAVDSSSGPSAGDVYVGDTCQRKIHKYDEGGNLIASWGNGGVLLSSESTFRFIVGMTVTESGQLFVRSCQECFGSDHASLVTFAQDGSLMGVVSTNSQDYREGLALSPGGSSMYYVGSEDANYAVKRASTSDGSGVVNFSVGAYEPPFNGFQAIAQMLASDSAGTLYATMGNYQSGSGRVWEWQVNGSGQPLDAEGNPCPVTLTASQAGCPPTHEFGSAVLGNFPRAVAVDDSSGRVYVTNEPNSAVDVFIAEPEAVAETEDANWVATATGTAKPDGAGDITECRFQFGATSSYGSSKDCSASGSLPYSSDTAVSAELPGLAGDGQHTYHYRLVLKNENGAVTFGADESFVPKDVKGLQTLTPEGISRTQATLRGSYEDTGKATDYYFEWGTSPCPCPNKSTEDEAASTSLSHVASSDGALSHLKPQTVYHYRVVAENEFGTTVGGDQAFETLPAVQNLTTEAANPVERRMATAKGSFQGDGTQTTYTFEWGPTASYGNALEVQNAGSPSTLQHVAMVIDGCPEGEPNPRGCLEPSYSDPANPAPKTYHYRITATDELGSTKGADQQFTSLPAVASLETAGATSIDQENISLNGKFEGNGEDTHYYFEYGLTTAYGMTTEPAAAGEAVGPTDVSSDITEYEGYETYHYRVVAENECGVTYGNDSTFETEAAPLPDIADTRASNVTPTSATLEAMINPNRWLTVYAFEYGPTETYGDTIEISEPIGADRSFHQVSNQIGGLQPGTLYHFRAVAINFTGTTYGPDQVLNTPDAPRIDLTSSSGVGQTMAHLSAAVNPGGSSTTVKFEYGTSAAYVQATAPMSIGSDRGYDEVAADLTGLTPGTTYHFRVVASSSYGDTNGPDQSFATQSASPTPPPHKPELKCRKGFVKRHGRCVRKLHHRRHASHG